ncbi:MAG: hypothetical protein AAGG11_20655 [Pseudomonadota bacterium]
MQLLDLNDTCLSLHDARGPRYSAAGYALLAAGELRFGAPALAEQRLQPLKSNNLYLDKLSAEPLPRTLDGAANHADLLYAQLLEVAAAADGAPVTVAVPSTVTPDQLALLLGVAVEAKLSIQRFVDGSVLTAATVVDLSRQPAGTTVKVLDLGLHHLWLSELETGPEVSRRSASALPAGGLHQLLESWLNVVADRFIQSTRFDPLHQAASEQQVFDQLSAWAGLNQLTPGGTPTADEDLNVSIETSGEVRSIGITAAALAAKTSQRLLPSFERLPSTGICVLSPRLAATPTVVGALRAARPELTLIEPDTGTGDYPGAVLEAHPEIFAPTDEVQLLQRLPYRSAVTNTAGAVSQHEPEDEEPTARAAAEPAPATEVPGPLAAALAEHGETPPPTHLLMDGIALSVERALFELGIPLARHGDSFLVMPGATPFEAAGVSIPVGTRLPSGLPFRWNGQQLQLIAVRGEED